MDTIEMVGTLVSGVMALVCFVLWRRESLARDVHFAKEEERFLQLQIKCGQLNQSQREKMQDDLQVLRSYVLEVKNYRDMRERLLADRVANIEVAVKALGSRIRP